MTVESFSRALLTALADTSPAFAPDITDLKGKGPFSRLMAALTDSTPAFQAGGHPVDTAPQPRYAAADVIRRKMGTSPSVMDPARSQQAPGPSVPAPIPKVVIRPPEPKYRPQPVRSPIRVDRRFERRSMSRDVMMSRDRRTLSGWALLVRLSAIISALILVAVPFAFEASNRWWVIAPAAALVVYEGFTLARDAFAARKRRQKKRRR